LRSCFVRRLLTAVGERVIAGRFLAGRISAELLFADRLIS
jgi:hypothetical protein